MENRKLFTPIKIGNVELPNRMIMAAMETGFCNDTDSLINDKIVNYFKLRAKGHPGLIIVGGGMIDPENRATKDMINICDDTSLEGLKRLTDAIHEEGTKCFIQLLHAGAYARSSVYDGPGPVAPSPVKSNFTGEVPHELTVEEILRIEKLYGQAVDRARRAGFDGVEICTNSGYLHGQFLSAVTNKRTDKYGGDLDHRLTFLRETLAEIRSAVGDDFPVSVRLGGNDLVPGGNTLEDAVEVAKAAEQAGASMISVTGGWHEAQVPQVTPDVPAGVYFLFGRKIKEAVTIPVTQSNRMNPQLAEEIVGNGITDMITMARPFLAEPQLADKAKAEDYGSIRPCLSCNQGCLDNLMRQREIHCLVNATVGREDVLAPDGVAAEDIPAEDPSRILVVGAGVAGLEFARVAASKGHDVTIWEKSLQTGGQVNLASVPESKRTFSKIIDYLTDACLQAGVGLAMGMEASADAIAASLEDGTFDKVVIAAGAVPITPHIDTEEGANVVQAWDVLAGDAATGNKVAVIGGGAVGVETAVHLAKEGTLTPEQFTFLYKNHVESPEYLESLLYKGVKDVSLLEMTPKIGKDIGPTTKWIAMTDLKKHGVKQHKNSRVLRITGEGVYYEFIDPKAENPQPEERFLEADTVVLAIGAKPEDGLYGKLSSKYEGRIYNIGDSSGIGKAIDAIEAAYKLAAEI